MRTIYYTASSLDGFIADEENSLAWLFQFGDEAEAGDPDYPAFIAGVGALAMGSTTYEWVVEHLMRESAGGVVAWPYSQPTWVFSSRDLPGIEGADLHFVRGDVRPVFEEMQAAAAGKDIWLVGGGDLVGQFHDHGLLDEILVTFAPVTLGAGAPLLPRRLVTPPLRLLSSRAVGGTFVRIHYAVKPEE